LKRNNFATKPTCNAANELLDLFPLSVEEHEAGVFLQKNECISRSIDDKIAVDVFFHLPPLDTYQCHDEDED